MLVDGDDMNEPIADAVRSILDGHVVLTRSLAHAGHYPAIDVLQSVSRLVGEIITPEVAHAGQQLRGALAALHEKQDLISIGAYNSGADPLLDAALEHRLRIDGFLRQSVTEPSDPQSTDAQLLELAASLEQAIARRSGEILDGEEISVEERPGAPTRARTVRDPRARVEPLSRGAEPALASSRRHDRDRPRAAPSPHTGVRRGVALQPRAPA